MDCLDKQIPLTECIRAAADSLGAWYRQLPWETGWVLLGFLGAVVVTMIVFGIVMSIIGGIKERRRRP